MRSIFCSTVLLALCILSSLALAGDAGRGKVLAYGCSCHGGELNGMKESKLQEKLTAFKKGEGSATMIKQMRNMSKKDIEDLAAFFASRK